MPILNFFKKQKDSDEPVKSDVLDKKDGSDAASVTKSKRGNDKKGDALSDMAVAPKKKNEFVAKKSVKKSSKVYLWIREPHITEKSTSLASANKYVFKVSDSSNKQEIKKAVESFYNVGVTKINVINMPGKKRRLGRYEGRKSGFRKAIITLKEGDKIEVMPH